MKTRWVIPAAVAMALHALVLFGFRNPPQTGGHVVDPPRLIPLASVAFIDVPEPPEIGEASPSAPRGGPDVPRSEDPVVAPRPDPRDFTMVPEVPRPGPVTSTHVIPIGPAGPGGGREFGPGSAVIPASNLDHAPTTRSQTAPIYPFEARHDGRDGEVLVEFTVDESGRVLNPRVIRSSDAVFEASTVRAVSKWRFEPGRKNGRPVRFRMALPVQFSVNS